MPLLEIATAQPSFQNHLGTLRARTRIHGKVSGQFSFRNEKRLDSAWKIFQTPKKVNFNVSLLDLRRDELLIKAIATLEPKCSVQSEDGHMSCNNLQLGSDSSVQVNQLQSLSEDSRELDERERLRRLRISKANKGNTPWNKGRKHSAETLQRIRDRTRLAMQDPKVKMKLVNLGHAQSEETRLKIGVGVRIGWQKRREKLMLQETCHFEWQNLIAEASRRGYVGEEELEWDSYKILDKQLEREWLESVEQRKKMPRPKGSKRAPKSLEQRRKISEAISAKWADPDYRDRVCSALAKYHGLPVGAERKPRRKPRGDAQTTRNPAKKKSSVMYSASGSESRSKSKRSNEPRYKDPLASSKLEMIKNIRAQRAAAETEKTEAIERAMMLIAEAEKAAKALEVAATTSPLARASLVETRKLIAEAIRSIESIDTEQITENGRYANGLVDKETETGSAINGIQSLASSNEDDLDFSNFTLQNLLNDDNDDEELLPTSSSEYDLDFDGLIKQLGQVEHNGNRLPNGTKIQLDAPRNSNNASKKWVRGRLIEVAEE